MCNNYDSDPLVIHKQAESEDRQREMFTAEIRRI